jgi:[ribosomal protein S5]-alanine N-acetyltransferase
MTIITTERLLLRPLHKTDAATIAREINHFEIARNLARVPFPYELRNAEEFITWTETLNHKSGIFAVEKRSAPDHLIGIVSHEWSETNQNSELGYWFAKYVWGKGFATEAARAAVHHAFTIADHQILISCYHNDNPASGRVLEKLGFMAVHQCNHFSVAQNKEVAVTSMHLTHEMWDQNTRRT